LLKGEIPNSFLTFSFLIYGMGCILKYCLDQLQHLRVNEHLIIPANNINKNI
jgi:hypothetical protein